MTEDDAVERAAMRLRVIDSWIRTPSGVERRVDVRRMVGRVVRYLDQIAGELDAAWVYIIEARHPGDADALVVVRERDGTAHVCRVEFDPDGAVERVVSIPIFGEGEIDWLIGILGGEVRRGMTE